MVEMSGSSWNDPIQRLIDKQLSSVWRENQLQRRQDRSKWIIKAKEQFPARNRIEDEMIRALDAKYFGERSRDKELLEFYFKEGDYTLGDISIIIGRDKKWIERTIRLLSAGWYV